MTQPTPPGVVSPPAPSEPSVPATVEKDLTSVLSAAPQIESVIAGLPQPQQIKAAALKLAGELHSTIGHLFQHHSIDDLIADAKKIEAYLSEGLAKIG
jgi:hypothetical protein